MKKILFASTALILSAAFAVAYDDENEKVIRMGTEGAYAPWNFINDSGEVDGFERELGDELCMRAELKCEWVTNDWDSIIPNLVSGNYDTIIAGMSITAERDETIDFTTNYSLPDPSAYAAMSTDIDLESAVIAVQTNTIHASFVAEQGWDLVEFSTPEETFSAVKSGEADVILADKSYLDALVDEDPEIVFLERTELLGDGVGIGLRESDTELKEKFNTAIESMKADGTLNALIVKWEIGETFE